MSASTTCAVCRVENGLHSCCCGNKSNVPLSALRAHLNRNFMTCATRDGHVAVYGLVDGSRAGAQLTCSHRHCNETFKTNDELQRHVRDVHVGATEGKIYCDDCKEYKSQSNWAKHLALHREQGPQIRGVGAAFATQKKRAHASARAAVASVDPPRKRGAAAAAGPAGVVGDGGGNYEVGGFGDVGGDGDGGGGARLLLDVVALPRGEQSVRTVVVVGATVPIGAPSDAGPGYVLGPTSRVMESPTQSFSSNCILPSLSRSPLYSCVDYTTVPAAQSPSDCFVWPRTAARRTALGAWMRCFMRHACCTSARGSACSSTCKNGLLRSAAP